ncbi:MAG TPA: hypothetical protein VKA08_17270 [Balneolales bacterium]|nr:hypothetical protein [Balneolales bacterium]
MKRILSHFFVLVMVVCLCLFASLVPTFAQSSSNLKIVKADNPDYIYAGRIDFSRPDAPKFYWAGNSATIGFTGRRLSVILDNAKGDNYFDIIIDGNGAHRHVIKCVKGRHLYTVAQNLKDTRHTVDVFRRIDPPFSGTKFEGIEIGKSDSVFRPDIHYKFKIAYYGDSITSGYGVLDTTGGKHGGDPDMMDNYVAYDAVTARHFDADYRSISRSGIGIIKSWYPLTMPQMYDRLNPNDPNSHWDFSKWTPDIVVINLFQNDSWLLPKEKNPPAKEQIIEAYIHFVETLRSKYPQADFICMLGNMDITRKGSPWPAYVETAVSRMRKKGDHHIYTLIVPYKHTPGHPHVAEQKSMSEMLDKKISEIRN